MAKKATKKATENMEVTAMEQNTTNMEVTAMEQKHNVVDELNAKAVSMLDDLVTDTSLTANDILSRIAQADLSDNEKLVLAAKVCELRACYTNVNNKLLTYGELTKKIRVLQSKKSMAKKAGNLEMMNKYEQMINELVEYRPTSSNAGGTGKAAAITIDELENGDLSKYSVEQLNKIIKSLQSKRWLAKQAGDDEQVGYYSQLIERVKSFKPAAAKASDALKDKIKEAITSLEALPNKTDYVLTQIEMLKSLL